MDEFVCEDALQFKCSHVLEQIDGVAGIFSLFTNHCLFTQGKSSHSAFDVIAKAVGKAGQFFPVNELDVDSCWDVRDSGCA